MKKKILSIMLALCMVLTALPITANAAGTAIYDLTQGSITIDDNSPENITINQSASSTANTIKISGTKNHTVTLNGLQIHSTNAMNSPVTVDSSGTTTLTLSNINTFNFDVSSQAAAVRKTAQGTLIIAGSGTLNVTGGCYNSDRSGGAAIGGNDGESTANIIIQSGTIQATSLSCAAAIGGGNRGSATNIQITGGNVNADSGYGAAIGGGGNNLTGGVTTYTGRNIIISGGTVKANTHDMNKCMAIGDGNVGSSDGFGMNTSGWGNVLQPSAGMVSKVEYTDNGVHTSFDGNYGSNYNTDITRFGSMQISFVAGYRLTVQNGTGSGLYLTGKPVNISFNNSGYDDPGYIEFSNWTLVSGSAAIAEPVGASTTLTMGNTDVTVTPVKAINYDRLQFVLSPVAIKGESGKTQQFSVGATYNGTALTAAQMAGLSYTTAWSLADAAKSTISSTGLLTMGAETENIKVNAAIQAGGKTYTAAADVLYKEADAGGLTISGGLLGLDYTYADNVLTFTGSGTYLVGMQPGVTTSATRIVVNGGSPKITLQNVNISTDSNANSIFCVRAGSPTVTISGTNSLINTNTNDGSNGISVMNGQSLTLDGGDNDALTAQGNYFSVVISQGGFFTIKGGHYSFGKSSGNVGVVKVDYYATCEVLGGIIELQEAWTGRDCNVINALGDFRISPAEGKQAAYKVKDTTKYLTEPYSTGTVIGYYTKISFSDSLPAITAASTGIENTSAGVSVNGTSSATGYYRLYEGGISSMPLAGDIMGSATGTVGLSKDAASSVSLTGLKEGTTYDCCIVAAAGSGESTQVSKVVKVHFTTLLAMPVAGDTSIDYAEEYLKAADTLAGGTILQYANTENVATWTDFSTGGVSLTSLLNSHTGTDSITLYVRKKAGEVYSAAAAVSIPARPLCSVPSLAVSYANETVTVPTGVVYQFSVSSPSSWGGAQAGTGSAVTLSPYISAAGTPEITWNKVFFRNPSTANSFASQTAAVEIPARPAVTVPTMSVGKLTFASIALNTVSDAEYKLTKINGNAVENAQYQSSNVFAELNPATKYTFVQHLLAVEKTAGADGHFASDESVPMEFTTAAFTVLYNDSAEKAEWYTNNVNISAMGYTVSDAKSGTFAAGYTVPEACTDKTLYFKSASGAVAPFAVSVKMDKTPPAGKITVGTSWWNKFLTDITFGFYHVDPSVVTIESSDGESGVKATQYLIAAEGTTYTREQLAAKADEWQDYNAGSKPTLFEGQKSVIYTKITNNAGLVTYLSSDGVILDNTAPTNMTIGFTQNPFKTVTHFVTFSFFFGNTVDVNFTAEDSGSGVDRYEYQTIAEGGTFDANGTWQTGSLSIASDFKGTIYARAFDKTGNVSGYAAKSLVVDKTAPVITANLGSPVLNTMDTHASFPVEIKDNGAGVSTVTYQIDGDTAKTVALTEDNGTDLTKEYSFSIGSLPDGAYNVTINAMDNSGNAAAAATVHIAKNAVQTGFGFASATQDKAYGDAPFTAAATGGQGDGTVTYTVTSGADVLSVDAATGKVTIQKVGTAVITAMKAAGGGYLQAQAHLTVNVSKGMPTVQTAPTASNITVIGKLSASKLMGGEAGVPGTFSWTNPGTVITKSGNYEVTFTPTDTDNYNTVTCNVPVTVSPIVTGNGSDAPQLDCTGVTMPAGVTAVSLGSAVQGDGTSAYSIVGKLIGQNESFGSLSGLTVYDLKLLDQSGNPIEQFTGKIKVKLRIYSGMSGDLKVFWYNPADDTLTDMHASQEDGYMVFETNHFSYYAIAQLKSSGTSPDTSSGTTSGTTGNPKTGSDNRPLILLALFASGSAAGTIIIKHRRIYRIKKKS